MPQINEYYPAKLLLFGEYTLLNGSQALAVPLYRWKGKWIKKHLAGHISLIPEYYRWLKKVELIDDSTYEKITHDFEEGWTYDADIPIGYGVGSSGAYVAALYERYLANESEFDFKRTTDTLAQMESYFHGSSSGMDPLVSFTKKAIYKDDVGIFQPVEDPGWPEGYKVYLLDSGLARETGPLVHRYKAQLQDDVFAEKIERQFIPMVEHALHFYLAGENKLLEECTSMISHFQRKHFDDMIPEHVKKQWDELVSKPGVYVKLCGAGGGGYFLVITSGHQYDLSSPVLITLS